ncbi:MAG: hypothetical protein WCJ21_03215 [Planctomycetota bacterium]
MPVITLDDIRARHPDNILPPHSMHIDDYTRRVEGGMKIAGTSRVAFLAICRNAMPWLPMTIERVRETAKSFDDWHCFIFENDSVDGSAQYLDSVAGEKITIQHATNGRPHLNTTKSSERTIALAEYRSRCQEFAFREMRDYDYAIVFDTDSWGGWSGIANSISWIDEMGGAGGMASYGVCEWGPPIWPHAAWCQFDAWAARWNYWHEERDMTWFHMWHPPVGSSPVKFNSAFGQLAVYRMSSYLSGEYRGGDCEHVAFHKTMAGDLYINPSQRVVSFWIPR